MIGVIAWRELRNWFITPTGWLALGLVQLIQGLIFYRLTQVYQAAPVTHGAKAGLTYNVGALSLGSAAYLAMLLVPLLTMHLISGERRRGTLPLLLSAPISGLQVVLGKYLGVLAFLTILMAQLAVMPLFLASGTRLDFGLLASAWCGTLLLLAAYSALGLYLSCLSARPVLAAVGSIAVLLLLWVLEMLSATGVPALDAIVGYLSIFQHYAPMLRGVVDTADVAYFLLLVTLFLGLSTLRINRMRIHD